MHTEQMIVKTELDKLKGWWEATFSKAKNHHKVAWVDQGMDATVLNTDLRSMALTEVRDEARRDICAIFGVDPILIGAMGKGSFSNTHEARLSLMQEVILPRGDYLSDVINAELVAYLDEGVELEMATDELPILQEDKDKKAARLKLMLDANVITVEFFRKEMGIPEDAGPSTDEIKAEADKALEAQKPEALNKWAKKATNALRAGRGANVAFDAPSIPETLRMAIRARLEQARTVADVELAFNAVYP
jgi:phage portal protein BeeE